MLTLSIVEKRIRGGYKLLQIEYIVPLLVSFSPESVDGKDDHILHIKDDQRLWKHQRWRRSFGAAALFLTQVNNQLAAFNSSKLDKYCEHGQSSELDRVVSCER
eukprot:scaffold27059_cov164-Skeletonema_menzelii.AAC.4